MLIAVNTRFLIHDKLEGMGRFTYEILSRITKSHPEHQFLFFFDRKHHSEFVFGSNVIPVELFPPARHPFLFYIYFEFSVARALKKYKPDVFLSTDGYSCLNTNVPTVLVFHDLAFRHYPEGINYLERKYYNYFFPKFAQKATRIAAVSAYTKHDLINQFNIPENKIDIVYNAAAKGFVPLDEVSKNNVRQQYSRSCDYFLYVGALHPRKNVETLLKAFEAFKQNSSTDIKLVIVGRKAWQTKEIEEVYQRSKFKNEILFTGRVPDEELYKITASALSLVYIPYFEGFGLPIVEAMNCDVPVITSNCTSMPEVAGDAAILVDPHSVEQTQQAMTDIANDISLRNKLIEAARLRKNKFNWDESAENLWNCMMKALKKQT